MKAFDYVIAGGGAAGCVLAARLAEEKVFQSAWLKPAVRAGICLCECLLEMGSSLAIHVSIGAIIPLRNLV